MLIAPNNDEGHSLEQILDRSHELRKQSERLKQEVTELAEKIERLQRRNAGNAWDKPLKAVDGAPGGPSSDHV